MSVSPSIQVSSLKTQMNFIKFCVGTQSTSFWAIPIQYNPSHKAQTEHYQISLIDIYNFNLKQFSVWYLFNKIWGRKYLIQRNCIVNVYCTSFPSWLHLLLLVLY